MELDQVDRQLSLIYTEYGRADEYHTQIQFCVHWCTVPGRDRDQRWLAEAGCIGDARAERTGPRNRLRWCDHQCFDHGYHWPAEVDRGQAQSLGHHVSSGQKFGQLSMRWAQDPPELRKHLHSTVGLDVDHGRVRLVVQVDADLYHVMEEKLKWVQLLNH